MYVRKLLWYLILGVLALPVNVLAIPEQELDLSSEAEKTCTAYRFADHGHAVYLPMKGYESVKWFFTKEGGEYKEYSDGTATLSGTVYNKKDKKAKFEIFLFFDHKISYKKLKEKGGKIKGASNGDYREWDFYRITSTKSYFKGKGKLKGKYLKVNDLKADHYVQVGYGANDKNGKLGLSTWFRTKGDYKLQGDVNVVLDCGEEPKGPSVCHTRSWKMGEREVFFPVPDYFRDLVFEGEGASFIQYDNGTAVLKGIMVNTDDKDVRWEVHVKFVDRKSYDEWTAMGGQAKEDRGELGDETTWYFYDYDKENSYFKGLGKAEGKFVNLENADPKYRFQVGNGANDYNSDFGASGWFLTTGTYNHIEGDFNFSLVCKDPDCFADAGSLKPVEKEDGDKEDDDEGEEDDDEGDDDDDEEEYADKDCVDEDGLKIAAEFYKHPVVPEGYSKIFVLTKGDALIIKDVADKPHFTVYESGTYRIHTLVFNGNADAEDFLDLSVVELGKTSGVDVLNLIEQSGICADLDVEGARFHVESCDPEECLAFAGTLKPIGDEAVCLEDGGTTIVAEEQGDLVLPDGYKKAYVLTRDTLVIFGLNTIPEFEVQEAGTYRIHTLVFTDNPDDPNFLDLSVVELKKTTGFEVLNLILQNEICASLDVAGAKFEVAACGSIGDFVWEDLNRNGCQDADEPGLEGIKVKLRDQNGNLAAGLVFTDANGQFIFKDVFPGKYKLEFTAPEGYLFTAKDQNNSCDESKDSDAMENGLTDVFTVESGENKDDVDAGIVSEFVCEANAGTLTPATDMTSLCLGSGEVSISATADGNLTKNEGYAVLYVLTRSDTLIIENVNTEPTFTVSTAGTYRIHTLVYSDDPNDENFLDLSVVVPGTTTGGDVLGIINDNKLCADLDVAGAKFELQACSSIGGIAWNDLNGNGCQDTDEPVLADVSIKLRNMNMNLLQGPITTNEQGEYSFDNIQPGNYRIEFGLPDGFAYTTKDETNACDDASDSDAMDNGMTEVITVAAGENKDDVDGGFVEDNACEAEAGTLSVAVNLDSCIAEMPIKIAAQSNGDAVVPDGYATLFVLTSGDELLIRNVNTIPEFEVSEPGLYRIHTLIYSDDPSDADFLDLSIVTPDVTTGVDVVNIITQEGICASLDVDGARFDIELCCDNVTDGGEIAANEIGCGPYDPQEIVNVILPTGGTGELEYLWLSTLDSSLPLSEWDIIENSNSENYDPPMIQVTTYYIRCARRVGCPEFIAESNVVTKEVEDINECAADERSITLEGTQKGSAVELSWSADYDEPGTMFTIEKSADNQTFKKIAETTSSQHLDNSSMTAYNYYRVSQDIDGELVYSNVVKVGMRVVGDRSITYTIYPVPGSDQLNISTPEGGDTGGRYQIQVIDMNGKVHYKGTSNQLGNESIDISALPEGSYNLMIMNLETGEIKTDRFEKI